MPKYNTALDFIEKAQKIHGNKYDYSQIEYKNNYTKVKIWCNTCKEYFWQEPRTHICSKCGCPKCGRLHCAEKIVLTTEAFIKKAKNIHKNIYDYSQVEYKNSKEKVKIFCKKCNTYFLQAPNNHLQGQGCPKCGFITGGKKLRLTKEQFIKKAKVIHKDKYDYSMVIYNGVRKKIKIFCNHCKNFFWQTPNVHLAKKGCPYCTISKGEIAIKNWLIDNKINFIQQKTFMDCRDKSMLRFDFYLPDYNLCIEFQGEQHYKPNMQISFLKSYQKGLEAFNLQQIHDQMKRNYCKEHNLKLLEIKYNQNIENELKEVLNGIQ